LRGGGLDSAAAPVDALIRELLPAHRLPWSLVAGEGTARRRKLTRLGGAARIDRTPAMEFAANRRLG
jgi:hypothetical protein